MTLQEAIPTLKTWAESDRRIAQKYRYEVELYVQYTSRADAYDTARWLLEKIDDSIGGQ